MKFALVLPALALLALAGPGEAAAQCNDACTRLVKTDGSHSGYGCVISEGSNSNCMATTTYCRLRSCSSVLLHTPEGHFAGVRDRCDGSRIESARVVARAIASGGRVALSATRHALIRRLALALTRARAS